MSLKKKLIVIVITVLALALLYLLPAQRWWLVTVTLCLFAGSMLPEAKKRYEEDRRWRERYEEEVVEPFYDPIVCTIAAIALGLLVGGFAHVGILLTFLSIAGNVTALLASYRMSLKMA